MGKGRGVCEVKMDRSLHCVVQHGGQLKVFKLVVVWVMQLYLSFRKLVLAAIRWEIITSKLR